MIYRIVSILLAVIIATGAYGADVEACKEEAKIWATKLGRDPSVQSTKPQRDCIRVVGKEYQALVSTKTGKVIMFRDLLAYPTDQDTDKSKWIKDEDTAWLIAENAAKKVDLALPPRCFAQVHKQDEIPVSYTLMFKDRPYGYEGYGVNLINIDVDAKYGKSTSISITDGFTYDKPSIKVSKEQACKAFDERYFVLTKEHLDKVEVKGLGYATKEPTLDFEIRDRLIDYKMLDPRADQTLLPKQSRLVYQIEAMGTTKHGRQSVIGRVDAETGLVLGGVVPKGTVLDRKRDSGVIKKKLKQDSDKLPSDQTNVWIITGGVTVLVAATYWALNKIIHKA